MSEVSAVDGPARRGLAARWYRFRLSPFLPAVVVSLIVSCAAGLFAGSYCWAMANPVPHHIPTAVTGSSAQGARFVDALEHRLNTSLALQRSPDVAAARQAVAEQRVFAIVEQQPGDVRLDVAAASGASVARVLSQAAPSAGRAAGVPVQITDIRPLSPTDPQGVAVFYVTLASVVLGFVGAIQLSVHAKALNPGERIAFTAGYAALGSLCVCAVVGRALAVLPMPLLTSWAVGALTMFTAGMVFTAFNTLFGRWAILPTWSVMILLGSPSSGGAVAWPLLPPVLGFLGRFLPPGASVNAQRNAIYFPEAFHLEPVVVLASWAVVAGAVFVVWRRRHPGGRTDSSSVDG
ncbi:ABC-2 transporter permease [Saccharopolyspora rosea]|uniref:ABC transporter permease n=1 Tax=Saccharopolyspora rosea TaxID=524884 RepID=A0ABW3FTM9_9PSEU|nr:ABC transporter permease [Saccharopolyspora rosea]